MKKMNKKMTTDLQTTQKIIRTLLLLLLINYTQQLPLPTTLRMQIQPLQSIPLQSKLVQTCLNLFEIVQTGLDMFKLVLFSVRISQSPKFKIFFYIFCKKKIKNNKKNVKIKNSILGLSPRSDLI